MDVIKPRLVWIEGRCYRFFESDAWATKDLTPYTEDSKSQEFSELNEDTCPIDIEITPVGRGGYKHSFYVPNIFFKFLIGANGVHKKRLESDTQTSIWVPKMGKDGDIVITGPSQTAVLSARHRIDLLVESSRKKLRPTHFISIPMIDKTIASNHEKLKNIILNETAKNAHGITEDIFQQPEKMHLTMAVLVLVDDAEVKVATAALEECREQIVKPFVEKAGRTKITVHGLEIMNDDPSEVAVVYGKVSTADNVLQELADNIMNFFVEKGLMKRENDKVNLHMTVMNASFILDKGVANSHRLQKFDATNILKVHKDYFFGEVMLNTIHMCHCGAKAEDGYYKIISKIDLTE